MIWMNGTQNDVNETSIRTSDKDVWNKTRELCDEGKAQLYVARRRNEVPKDGYTVLKEFIDVMSTLSSVRKSLDQPDSFAMRTFKQLEVYTIESFRCEELLKKESSLVSWSSTVNQSLEFKWKTFLRL